MAVVCRNAASFASRLSHFLQDRGEMASLMTTVATGGSLMEKSRLLFADLQLPLHHQLEIASGLDGPQIVRCGHDVLSHDRNPLNVVLPFWRGACRWWRCEQRCYQRRIGYE